MAEHRLWSRLREWQCEALEVVAPSNVFLRYAPFYTGLLTKRESDQRPRTNVEELSDFDGI